MSEKNETSEEYRFPVDEKYGVDFNKGLLRQVMKFNRDDYSVWVHTPVGTQGRSPPMFDNAFLEYFTKNSWYIIPIFWWPIIALSLVYSINNLHESETLMQCLAYFVIGAVVVWPFLEYTLHRFLFHMDEYMPDHPVFIVLHFLLHGIHHLVPMDRYRLVFPPIAGCALLSILSPVIRFLVLPKISFQFYLIFQSGIILGYTIYDVFHYLLHHGSVPNKDSFVGKMKKYHMKHHYTNWQVGFGITSKLWDLLFGTVLRLDTPKKVL